MEHWKGGGWNLGLNSTDLGAQIQTLTLFPPLGPPLNLTQDFEASGEEVELSFSKNGEALGVAFRVPKEALGGRALLPHVLCKGCAVQLNFGQTEPLCPPAPPGYVFIHSVPPEQRVRTPPAPAELQQCEVRVLGGGGGGGNGGLGAEGGRLGVEWGVWGGNGEGNGELGLGVGVWGGKWRVGAQGGRLGVEWGALGGEWAFGERNGKFGGEWGVEWGFGGEMGVWGWEKRPWGVWGGGNGGLELINRCVWGQILLWGAGNVRMGGAEVLLLVGNALFFGGGSFSLCCRPPPPRCC